MQMSQPWSLVTQGVETKGKWGRDGTRYFFQRASPVLVTVAALQLFNLSDIIYNTIADIISINEMSHKSILQNNTKLQRYLRWLNDFRSADVCPIPQKRSELTGASLFLIIEKMFFISN